MGAVCVVKKAEDCFFTEGRGVDRWNVMQVDFEGKMLSAGEVHQLGVVFHKFVQIKFTILNYLYKFI